MSGVYGYFGVTTSGKTTLALEHLRLDVGLDGRSSLILDCMPAKNLREFRHCESRLEAIQLLYAKGTHAVYTPKDEEDLAALFDVIHYAGSKEQTPIHVLWDEASIHQSPLSIDDRIAVALRGWQHNDCTFRLVTQRPGDLHGVFYSCIPEVYCFRLERARDLERVRAELSLPAEVIAAQPQGKYETYSRDRFKKVDAHEPPPPPVPAPAAPPAPAAAAADGGVQRSDVVPSQPGAA